LKKWSIGNILYLNNWKSKQFKNDKTKVIEVPLTSDEKFGFVTAETEEI
jgi:hypothetical protein